MRVLLDINVLLALLDASHAHHSIARNWLTQHIGDGWASCPLTQNGYLRIASSAAYPNALPVAGAVAKLRAATTTEHHEFWTDSVSLLEPSTIDATRLHGSKQLTDAYLLALAVAHHATFVTFDANVAHSAVIGAEPAHLTLL